ncbi:small ribosomal subunit protein bS18m [Pelobates fuscus]|uniref:small ribosomal subunit protein bS18m n=1 Tax=Pelobates fuscus TaxID=191477 RepID=UPI002FE4CB61
MLVLRLLFNAACRRQPPAKLACPLALSLPGRTTTIIQLRNQTSQNMHEDMPQQMENPYKEPPKKCVLCGVTVDYKNTQLLSQFISSQTGRMYGRHITGLCNKKQKAISKAIKRARIMGYMPVAYKDPAFLKDPKICDI